MKSDDWKIRWNLILPIENSSYLYLHFYLAYTRKVCIPFILYDPINKTFGKVTKSLKVQMGITNIFS